MSSTMDETVNLILDHLFTNGAKEVGQRLLLIQEDYSGKAKVTDARYLGGYSRLPVRDILLDALRAHEQAVRAEERQRLAEVINDKIDICDRHIKLNDEQGRDWAYGCWRDMSNTLRSLLRAISRCDDAAAERNDDDSRK